MPTFTKKLEWNFWEFVPIAQGQKVWIGEAQNVAGADGTKQDVQLLPSSAVLRCPEFFPWAGCKLNHPNVTFNHHHRWNWTRKCRIDLLKQIMQPSNISFCWWNFHLIASPKDVGPGYVAEVTANAMVWTQKYLLGQGFDLNLPEFAKKLPMFLNMWTASYTCRFEDFNLSPKEEILRNLLAFGAQKMGSMDGSMGFPPGILPYWWPELEEDSSCATLLGSAEYVGHQVPRLGWFLTGSDSGMIWGDHVWSFMWYTGTSNYDPTIRGWFSLVPPICGNKERGIRRGIYCGYLWMVALGFPHYHCHQAQINQQSTQPWQRRLWGLDSGDPTLLQPLCHLAEKICGHLWPMVRSRRPWRASRCFRWFAEVHFDLGLILSW